ncbi:TIGR01621 family pseudouridine synthase [Motiliproteus coralliicola]|uniref:TIGR01621 family pseudouridine synthase n=1 Tax=Motiliproteus coralliicola TaxID=2283196 RepID=A0A369WWH7_9GAMM|nr:TIGR01621 family pseudouridine synthase [Motiliproteus coralliicola]RDE24896.1 TIGR01621 family pseudouridine synthase [Motiliproteus coralliicola]
MSKRFEVVDIQPGFVVIDKSAEVSFHSEAEQPGLVTEVETQLGVEKLYPVHRLDRMTSGLLLLATSAEAAEQLNRQFRQGTVQKYYLALSDRKPKKKQGLISGDMAKGRRGSWRLLKSKQNPARTRFFSVGLGDGLRLYLLKPLTGKTHQIRVALKSIGAPILGDRRYYPLDANQQTLRPDRGYLHAYAIGFEFDGEHHRYRLLPRQGGWFQSELVVDQLQRLGDPDQLAWPD